MSLFPALMFLLVLSVIGVSALNSTLMQEKMVSNTKDLNIAFQAAEAGLRDAEADVGKNIDAATAFTFVVRQRALHATVDLAVAVVGGHLQGRRLERHQQVARVRRIHGLSRGAYRRGATAVRHRETVDACPSSPAEASAWAAAPHACIRAARRIASRSSRRACVRKRASYCNPLTS